MTNKSRRILNEIPVNKIVSKINLSVVFLQRNCIKKLSQHTHFAAKLFSCEKIEQHAFNAFQSDSKQQQAKQRLFLLFRFCCDHMPAVGDSSIHI